MATCIGDDQPSPATGIDPDETARFQLQSIINFLEVKPKIDLSPGVQESLSWAQSSACAAARRIFDGMGRKGAGS